MGHHGRVSTDTKVRPDVTTDDSTTDDTPKYFHYVKKNKIAESAVMGTHVVALCGEVFPVTRVRQARVRPSARSARRSTRACASRSPGRPCSVAAQRTAALGQPPADLGRVAPRCRIRGRWLRSSSVGVFA